MNLLPNHSKAVLPIEKLSEYVLNEFHPAGKHKAFVFKRLLNLTYINANELKQEILNALNQNEAIEKESDIFGRRFIVRFDYPVQDIKVIILTVWIIRTDEDFPRFVTCYIE